MMRIESLLDGFLDLIDPGTEIETISEGFEFTEGPVWNSRENKRVNKYFFHFLLLILMQ